VRELATGTNAAEMLPDYVRSPEAKYPQANEEAYAVAEWITAHGQEKGLDNLGSSASCSETPRESRTTATANRIPSPTASSTLVGLSLVMWWPSYG